MKKSIFIVFVIITCCSLYSCGTVEKMYDQGNYESLTNEKGIIELYSGGKLIRTLSGKVVYSSSDSLAMYIQLNTGERVYWQGEAFMKIN